MVEAAAGAARGRGLRHRLAGDCLNAPDSGARAARGTTADSTSRPPGTTADSTSRPPRASRGPRHDIYIHALASLAPPPPPLGVHIPSATRR